MKNRRAAQPQFVVDGGISADDRARWNIVGDAGLGGGDGAVADLAVPGDADLSGENDVLADIGGAGQVPPARTASVFSPTREPWPTCTRLSIFAPLAMRVSPTLARSMQALAWTSTSSSSTAGPDCTILCQWPGVVLGEAEAVGADDRSVLQHDIVAEPAMLAHDRSARGRRNCRRCARPDRSPRAPAASHSRRWSRSHRSRRTVRCARWRRSWRSDGRRPWRGCPGAYAAAGRRARSRARTRGRDFSSAAWPPGWQGSPRRR